MPIIYASSVSIYRLLAWGLNCLSDFFYVWLRHSLRPVFPDLFATLVVPKAEELVATPVKVVKRKLKHSSSKACLRRCIGSPSKRTQCFQALFTTLLSSRKVRATRHH